MEAIKIKGRKHSLHTNLSISKMIKMQHNGSSQIAYYFHNFQPIFNFKHDQNVDIMLFTILVSYCRVISKRFCISSPYKHIDAQYSSNRFILYNPAIQLNIRLFQLFTDLLYICCSKPNALPQTRTDMVRL